MRAGVNGMNRDIGCGDGQVALAGVTIGRQVQSIT